MATRRLTDAFLLLRNNSIQNRQLLAEQVSSHTTSSPLHSRSLAALADDRMALVSGLSLDPEAAIGVTKRLPPKWVDGVDEIQYDVSRIKQKMKELAGLHDKHLNRPTLDDSSEEEHAIEITTQEITQLFHRCQRAVQALRSRVSRGCSQQEERLLRNVVASLAQALQELSSSFRHAQSGYLKRMKNREERSQHFFDTSVPLMDDGGDNTLYDRAAGKTHHLPAKTLRKTHAFLGKSPEKRRVILGGFAGYSPCLAAEVRVPSMPPALGHRSRGFLHARPPSLPPSRLGWPCLTLYILLAWQI
ncbi:syntaxin-16 isoform X3 [Loxodonta africana]|uniref:syntaxin-16 isoform X3 n=1 Tax=Loxodonta africana TaxID=9785 RepID=UPI0030D252D2